MLDIPTGASSFFNEDAYNYVTENWCITNSSDSLFQYQNGTDFEYYNNCGMIYEPLVFEVPVEVKEKCNGDHDCEVDGTILGLEAVHEFIEDPELNRPQPLVVTERLVEDTDSPTPGPTPGPTQDPAKRVCVGKGWGDPHMVTFDGLKFNAQTRGEVIVSTSLQDPGYMIQGRFVPTNRGKLNKMTGTFAHNVCCCI